MLRIENLAFAYDDTVAMDFDLEVPDGALLSLIGPSAGGLPDVVFERGVRAVGGTQFSDREKLLMLLERQESWGKAGRKYRLRREGYPGLEALLQRAAATRS